MLSRMKGGALSRSIMVTNWLYSNVLVIMLDWSAGSPMSIKAGIRTLVPRFIGVDGGF